MPLLLGTAVRQLAALRSAALPSRSTLLRALSSSKLPPDFDEAKYDREHRKFQSGVTKWAGLGGAVIVVIGGIQFLGKRDERR